MGGSRTTENFLRNKSGEDLRNFSVISNEPPRMSETSTHDQRCGLKGYVNKKKQQRSIFLVKKYDKIST